MGEKLGATAKCAMKTVEGVVDEDELVADEVGEGFRRGRTRSRWKRWLVGESGLVETGWN